MKNVVIFAGGHGAVKLQQSIAKWGGPGVNVQIVISAYDNAKSTLACRQVFDHKILGVSDLRKNHITQYKIQQLNDSTSESNSNTAHQIYDWLEYRLPKDWNKSFEETYAYVKDTYVGEQAKYFFTIYDLETLKHAVDNFFLQPKAKDINYADFALSNILYASLANMNGNSLEKAGNLMSKMLGIEDNVHLISNVNLYLHAKSVNGQDLNDEDVMSQWKSASDPIDHLYYVDRDGNEHYPTVDELPDRTIDPTHRCEKLLDNADIIIFSSGSQWTSLIPTYAQHGFNAIIKRSKAKKYLVMNNVEDRDLYGCNADWILAQVSKYVDIDDFTIVLNSNAISTLDHLEDKKWKSITAPLSDFKGDPVHNLEVFKVIMADYVKPLTDYSHKFVFDFDDTLWSTKTIDADLDACADNLIRFAELKKKGIWSMIFSGNKIARFKKLFDSYACAVGNGSTFNDVFSRFYCNFGNSKYHFEDGKFLFDGKVFKNISMFSHYFNLVDYLVKSLNKSRLFLNFNTKLDYSNFENCGDVNIAVSPLCHREEVLPVFNELIDEYNAFYYTDFHAYINGNTTIDILYKDFNKASCLNEVLRDEKFNYIGDKLEDGNDASVKTIKLANCISVDDVYDTNFLLRALEAFNA